MTESYWKVKPMFKGDPSMLKMPGPWICRTKEICRPRVQLAQQGSLFCVQVTQLERECRKPLGFLVDSLMKDMEHQDLVVSLIVFVLLSSIFTLPAPIFPFWNENVYSVPQYVRSMKTCFFLFYKGLHVRDVRILNIVAAVKHNEALGLERWLNC